jgi:hypothetical protein
VVPQVVVGQRVRVAAAENEDDPTGGELGMAAREAARAMEVAGRSIFEFGLALGRISALIEKYELRKD